MWYMFACSSSALNIQKNDASDHKEVLFLELPFKFSF
jgi:hypothetical protein